MSGGNPHRPDALVVGGGPAGSTAAALLASWGRSVVMVHRESGQPDLAESLPASTRKLLRFLGQLDAVDAASFHPNYGNLSRWAGAPAVATSDEAGYHVSRRELDRRLRDHAAAQGAVVVHGQVQRIDLREPPVVSIVGPTGKPADYGCRFVLDCSGRAGVVARKGLRRSEAGYRTLAVAAEWECGDWPADERMHTIVDSYQDGWAWSVPLSATRRQCTVMIDRERTVISKPGLEEIYRRELHKAAAIAQRLAGARPTGRPWACDASVYDASRSADGCALLVGDAASFIEPLSSAGVKKALTSAWRAAVVVNTCLAKPDFRDRAFDFYNLRERQVFVDCVGRARTFFESAAAYHRDPFWTTRANWHPSDTLDGGSELTERDLSRDPSIRDAFQRLRAAPVFALTRAPALAFVPAADIEGREIVMREAVVVPGLTSPVRFAAGVDLPALIRLATETRDVGSLFGAYETRIGKVSPDSLLKALSMLVAKELLVMA
jgi:flavin-dependent dehydrogenase